MQGIIDCAWAQSQNRATGPYLVPASSVRNNAGILRARYTRAAPIKPPVGFDRHGKKGRAENPTHTLRVASRTLDYRAALSGAIFDQIGQKKKGAALSPASEPQSHSEPSIQSPAISSTLVQHGACLHCRRSHENRGRRTTALSRRKPLGRKPPKRSHHLPFGVQATAGLSEQSDLPLLPASPPQGGHA